MIKCVEMDGLFCPVERFAVSHLGNSGMVECLILRALETRLRAMDEEYVFFGSRDDLGVKQVAGFLHGKGVDILVGGDPSINAPDLLAKRENATVILEGISIFERLLSDLDSYYGLSFSLGGKVFNRRWLLSTIQSMAGTIQSIPVRLLTLLLFVKAGSVVLLPWAVGRNTSTDQSPGPDCFFDESSLSGLNEVAIALNGHSAYFERFFSGWLANTYLTSLMWIQDDCSHDELVVYTRLLQEKLTAFPDLRSLLLIKALPLLPSSTRMLINAYQCGHFNATTSLRKAYSRPQAADTLFLDSKKGIEGELPSKDTPLVTIITVVRNLVETARIGFFEIMLASVSDQNYPQSAIEHLVVDGNSSDGTLDYLVALWKSGRISKLISEPDTSVYNAMNKAMSYVNGECFLFLNSDDYLSIDAVARLSQTLFDRAVDYVFADAWQIDYKNNKVGVVKGEIDSAWFKVPYCHQTLMCRTSPLSRHRFDESYKITMMKYALELRAGPYKWAYVAEKLAYYRIGDGVSSAPANRDRYLAETYRAKDYSADKLGLSSKQYEELDQAWRRVTTDRHYEQFVSLVAGVKSDMPANGLTDTFCQSIKRFGAYRLAQYRKKHPDHLGPPVRLALFNSHAYGGAGSAVLRLHLALRDSQVIKPTMITRDMIDDRVIPDSLLVEESDTGWNAQQHRVRTAPGATLFTVDEGCIPSNVLDEVIASHDVFSLQWTARMLSVKDIGRIVNSGKPVFITVRDMEPISGGCHYFHGCMNWRYRQCHDCPQIIVGDKRIASDTFAEKVQVLARPNVTFIALSEMSASVLRQSPLAYANPVIKVGNGFDPDTFRVLDRNQARRALGLDEAFTDRYLIGMMPSFSSTIKGYDVALAVLRQAEQQSADFQKRSGVLVAGYPADDDDLDISLPMKGLGALKDAGELNLFYSACDLIIVPSREETFSNTVAEAMLCGTPVFGAMAGAIPEMITNKVNGRLFSHDWESARIAETLLSCYETEFSQAICRSSIVDSFPQSRQVACYEELFSRATAD